MTGNGIEIYVRFWADRRSWPEVAAKSDPALTPPSKEAAEATAQAMLNLSNVRTGEPVTEVLVVNHDECHARVFGARTRTISYSWDCQCCGEASPITEATCHTCNEHRKWHLSVMVGGGRKIHAAALLDNGFAGSPLCGAGQCSTGVKRRSIPRQVNGDISCAACLKRLAEGEGA